MTTPATPAFQAVPEFMPNEKEHRRQLARAIKNLTQAKFNATLTVTLTANDTTTTINDYRIGAYSAIVPAMATTAHAATAIAAGIYVDTITGPAGINPGSSVIHHANSANTDQTIVFLIIG